MDPGNTILVMAEVLVEAEKITPTTGTVILDKETIEALPIRNGHVNEIISIVPGVQYNEGSADSFTQGEIQPPPVSISGSRFYDNNYTIDGTNNNSPLDPASDTQQKDNKLPGHPQIHILNSQMIDQVTVYNSNIPAEYGASPGDRSILKSSNRTMNSGLNSLIGPPAIVGQNSTLTLEKKMNSTILKPPRRSQNS